MRIKVKHLNKFQKNTLLVVGIMAVITVSVTLGRYVYDKVLEFYFTTQNFYFESDKLTKDEALYSLDYWNGVDPYNIVINLNSYKNSKLKSDGDIEYEISFNCSDSVICQSNKEKGIIYSSSNTDSFTVTITPNQTFKDGDSVVAQIVAKSVSPYKKTLSAQFKLVVGTYGLSHEIADSAGDVYLEVKVTNTLLYYTVKEAFDDYSVGDQITNDEYVSLNEEKQNKCRSASITLSFDPSVVYVDNNSTTYLKGYDVETEKLNGYDYINKFTFDMEASSSSVVRFYKKDSSKDYSNTDIVKVEYDY